MKTYPKLRVPAPRRGLKLHLRSSGFVVTRPTIASAGNLVRRLTFAFVRGRFLYRPVPAALPPGR